MTPSGDRACASRSAQVCDDASHRLCLAQCERARVAQLVDHVLRSRVVAAGRMRPGASIAVVDPPAVHEPRRIARRARTPRLPVQSSRRWRAPDRAAGRAVRGPYSRSAAGAREYRRRSRPGRRTRARNRSRAAAACCCRRSRSGAYRLAIGQSERVKTNTTALAASSPDANGRTSRPSRSVTVRPSRFSP